VLVGRCKKLRSSPCPHLLLPCRGVWRGVLRAPEAAREEGDSRGHQGTESRLHGEAETGLPERSQHHGAVRPPQCHPPGGGGDQEYVAGGDLVVGQSWDVSPRGHAGRWWSGITLGALHPLAASSTHLSDVHLPGTPSIPPPCLLLQEKLSVWQFPTLLHSEPQVRVIGLGDILSV